MNNVGVRMKIKVKYKKIVYAMPTGNTLEIHNFIHAYIIIIVATPSEL